MTKPVITDKLRRTKAADTFIQKMRERGRYPMKACDSVIEPAVARSPRPFRLPHGRPLRSS